MAEVSTKDLPRNLFKVTRVAIEIVSVGVEVPDPGCGLGAFRESSVEMSGLAEQFKVAGLSTFSTWLFAVLPRSGGLMVIESFLEGRDRGGGPPLR